MTVKERLHAIIDELPDMSAVRLLDDLEKNRIERLPQAIVDDIKFVDKPFVPPTYDEFIAILERIGSLTEPDTPAFPDVSRESAYE